MNIKKEEKIIQEENIDLFDAMLNGFALHKIVTDKDGKPIDYIFLKANKAFENIIGFKQNDIINKKVTEVLPGIEKDSADWINVYGEIALSGNSKRFRQYSEKLKKWFRISAYSPKKYYFATITEDITEKLKEENKLKESEKRYREIFEGSRDGFVIVDLDGRILNCNSAYSNMLGYSKEDLKKINFLDITPKKWHDWEWNEIIKKKIQVHGYSGLYQKEYIRKDGTIFPVELQAYLVKDDNNNPIFMWAVVRDITDKKTSEDELKNSKEKFEMIFDKSPEFIIFFNSKGVVQEVNEQILLWLGYEKKDIIGKKISSLELLSEKTKKIILENFKNRMAGAKIDPYEIELIAKDGSIKIGRLSASVIGESNDNMYGDLVMVTNITDQKKMEEMYKLVSENTSDFISITSFSEKPKYLYLSPSVKQILGYEPGELINKVSIDMIHPDDLEKMRFLLVKYLKNGINILKENNNKIFKEILEYRIKHKSGKWIYMESVANLVEDKIIFISRDVSERQKSENEIKEKLIELERFNRATVGRELKMMELKNENKILKEQIEKLNKK